ncbi:MAG: FecR domain-containing protein [Pseudomonadota bacterium]
MTPNKDGLPEEIRAQAYDWFMRVDTGELSASDKLEFDRWLKADFRHQHAYDRATTFWSALGTLTENELGGEYLNEPTLVETPRPFVRGSMFGLGSPFRIAAFAGVAASLALCSTVLVNTFLFRENTEQVVEVETLRYSTEIGKTEVFLLADGSEITLGAASDVEVRLEKDKRRIELKNGSAAFKVARDETRPFIVQADDFTARVLGTEFDVRKSDGVYRLSVLEGKVEASYPIVTNGRQHGLRSRETLTGGQQIAASNADGLAGVSAFDASSFALWRDDRLKYVGGKLGELIADANRYSTKPIRFDGDATSLAALEVTLSFNGRNIPELLATLEEVLPIAIDQGDPEVIRISAE